MANYADKSPSNGKKESHDDKNWGAREDMLTMITVETFGFLATLLKGTISQSAQ